MVFVFFFFKFLFGRQLLYYVMLVSAIQQREKMVLMNLFAGQE